MRQLATVVVLLATVVSGSARAKDLGTIGHLFPIAEPDLLTFIGQRLKGMEDSGEMDRLQREAEARVKAHAVRPAPVAGLTPARTDRAFLYDPTFTVRETIRDMRGNVIARAGDKVNPLDRVAFSETLYFVDGDNPQQMAWLKLQITGQQNFKVILVKGNVHDSSIALDTGGSIYLRNPVKQVQLISMQVPSLNAGCGGIDSYLGAFSYINGAELQRFVKQIMSNAAGYAFDLALQTMVPELKQAKDFLQKLASDVNSANMSSCQAAQGIIGGLWPVSQVSNQKICQDIAGESNIFSDWAASRQGCTVGGQGDSVTGRASDNMKDQVLKNKNLIWDALGRNHLFDGNRQLKELVMSVVGSIIFNKAGQVTVLTPLVDNRDIITVLMRGGTAKMYGCDEPDLCLGPTVASVTVSSDIALVTQVRNLMISIDSKLTADTGLSDREKGFINTTSVPVLKYLTNSRSMGMSPTYLIQVADFIAQDMMIQYLQELVKQASQSLAGKNFPEQAAGELRNNVLAATSLLAQMKLQSTADQNALDGIDRNMQYLQQQVSTIISTSYQGNYQWGTGND